MTEDPKHLESLKQLIESMKETDKTKQTLNAAIVTLLADIQTDLRDLSAATIALRLTLCEKFPDFQALYSTKLASQEVLSVKQDYEHRIDALRQAVKQIVES